MSNQNTELMNTILKFTYLQGRSDAMRQIEEIKREKREMKRRKLYLLKQRIYGIILLILPLITIWAADGDATIAIVTVPLGMSLLISKDMMIVNDYFWENE